MNNSSSFKYEITGYAYFVLVSIGIAMEWDDTTATIMLVPAPLILLGIAYMWLRRYQAWQMRRADKRLEELCEEVVQQGQQVVVDSFERRGMRRATAWLVERGNKFGIGHYILGLVKENRKDDARIILKRLELHDELLANAEELGVRRHVAMGCVLRNDVTSLQVLICLAKDVQRVRKLVEEAVVYGMPQQSADSIAASTQGETQLRRFVEDAKGKKNREGQMEDLAHQVSILPAQKRASVAHLLEIVRSTVRPGGKRFAQAVHELEKALSRL